LRWQPHGAPQIIIKRSGSEQVSKVKGEAARPFYSRPDATRDAGPLFGLPTFTNKRGISS
jgi:hypothetical protein